jgi:hypothetical protein
VNKKGKRGRTGFLFFGMVGVAGDEKNDLLYLPVISLVGGDGIYSFFEQHQTGKNGEGQQESARG